MKAKKLKRLLALLVCLCMALGMMPMTVFAQGGKTHTPTEWDKVQDVIDSMDSGDILDLSGFGTFEGGYAGNRTLRLGRDITIQGTWDRFGNMEGFSTIADLHFSIENGAEVTMRNLYVGNDDLLSHISGTGNLILHDVEFRNKHAEEVSASLQPIIDLEGDVIIYGKAESNPVNGVAVSTTIQGKCIKQVTGNKKAGDVIHARNVTIYGGNIGGGEDFGYSGRGGDAIVASGQVTIKGTYTWGTGSDQTTLYSNVNLNGGYGSDGGDAIVAAGDVYIEGGYISGGGGMEYGSGEGGSAVRSGGNVTLVGQWLPEIGNEENSFTDTYLNSGVGECVPGVPIVLTGSEQTPRRTLQIQGAKVTGCNKGRYAAPYTIEMQENDLAIIDNSLIGWYTDIPIFSTGFYQITNQINTWGTLDNATEFKITEIEIAAFPQKTEYTEGDALDLSGLLAKLIYSDNGEVVVSLENFNENSISTTPVNGAMLAASDTVVTISMGELSTTFNITINPKLQQVQTPVFSPEGGIYESVQSVEMTCATEGAEIYYTTDGAEPTINSIQYIGAITISDTSTLKAIAVKEGMTDSEIAEGTYTIQGVPIHDHSWSAEWENDDGSHWYNCTTDDCPVIENSEKSGYGQHVESEWITTQVPTENAAGSRKKECIICGYELTTEEIPAFGLLHTHMLTKVAAEDATCVAAGHTEYQYCGGCGKYFGDGGEENEIEWSDIIIPATGSHTPMEEWQYNASSHWRLCLICNQEMDRAAHSGGTADCHQKAVCDTCGTEYGALRPDNHDGPTELRDYKAPTENEKGYTGDTYCLGCGTKLADGMDIPKLVPGPSPSVEYCLVRYDAGEGRPVPQAVTVKKNAKLIYPEEPVRDGYSFGGWHQDAACTIPWDFEKDLVLEDITLHAKWNERIPEEMPPGQVQVSLMKKTTNQVQISWTPADGADGYTLWTREEGETSYTRRIIQSGNDNLTYAWKNRKPGTKYYFVVKAWVKTKEGKYLFGEASKTVRGTTKPLTARIGTVTVNEAGDMKVMLKETAKGADRYAMCYSYQPDFGRYKIGIRTKYTVRTMAKELRPGTYYVKVRSYRQLDKSRVYGDWSRAVKVVVK